MPRAHLATASRLASACALAFAIVLAGMQAAEAQTINRCRIDGQLVLQSSPCPLEARPGLRTAAFVEAPATPGVPRKRTLAEVLRARDGGDPPPVRTIQGDGAVVLPSRMGAG